MRVVVTNKDAIYVNDRRITDRATKWGIHSTVCEFECAKKDMHKELKERGYGHVISRIVPKDFEAIEEQA